MSTTSRKVSHRSTSAQASQPSSVRIEPESQTTPTTERETAQPSWLAHHQQEAIDDLAFQIPQLRALANAMYCVAAMEGRHFFYNNSSNESQADQEIAPLSLLSQRLCDEVEQHVYSLTQRLQTYKEQEQADLTDILTKRAEMTPDRQALVDEVARILGKATPAQKAILALGIEGVKQKAQQKKSMRESSKQSNNERNDQGKG